MRKIKNDIVVGLDIGTTKICAIVARMNENHRLEVIGFGKAESHGVLRGEVFNIDKTTEAIKIAVAQAEAQSCVKITNVYVGIAGKHIRSMQNRAILTRGQQDQEITDADVNHLIQDMYKMATNPGERIIHVLPQEFTVDAEHGIKDPVGMCGNRLEGNFHIITGQVIAAQNIEKSVIKAGLSMSGLVLEPLASSASVLSEEEKEAGVALVDIGGGTTDIAIFQDHIIRHTAVIPFGGNIITEDIKTGLMVMRNQAEQLKLRFGSALAIETMANEIISIPGLKGRDPKEISVRNLSHIIESRIQEIFEQVYFEIKISGYANKLIGGIVLTGGGSQLKHLKQLVEYVTGMDCRIGYPVEHLEKTSHNEIKFPMYATGVGLVLKGFEDMRANGLLYEEVEEEAPIIAEPELKVVEEEAPAARQMHPEEVVPSPEELMEKRKRDWFQPLKNWFKSDTKDFED